MSDKVAIRGVSVVLTTESAAYEQGMAGATAALDRFKAANSNAAKQITGHTKVIQQAGLNLSRQFTDIGVQLAGGQSPFLILTQQLPQMADAFAMAKTQGVGFKGVVGGLARGIAPMVPALAGVAAGVAVAAAGFGLFERAIDKQTKYATTWGDTWNATIKVVGKAIMDGPIGDGLKWLGGAAAKAMDAVTNAFMGGLDWIVGQWGAGFQLIVNNWRRLPEVMGVLAQQAANNVIGAIEGLLNASIKGLNVLLKAAGLGAIGLIDLPEIKLANKQLTDEFKASAASISASFKKGREAFGDAIIKQTDREFLNRQKAKKATEDHTKALKKNREEADASAEAFKRLTERVQNFAAELNRGLRDRGLTQLQKVQRDLREGLADIRDFEGGAATSLGASARLSAELTERWAEAQQAVSAELIRTPDDLAKAVEGLKDATSEAESFADAMYSAADGLDGIASALKSGDFARGLGALSQTFGSLSSLSGGSGMFAQLATQAAALAPYAALIQAGMDLNALVGGSLAGLAGGDAKQQRNASLGGRIGGLIGALAGFALGGKSSNKGAGLDLVTGQLSGNRRSAETEDAVRAAGDVIKAGQDALRGLGATLTATVQGLVIGTRDASQIYLTNGQVLTSAVGDTAAAAETALRGVLQGATFVDEAQRKLVDNLLAAGKGFEDITTALAAYADAQKISGNLADRILQLTDPKAFDVKSIQDAIAAERAAVAAQAEAGYLTAEQLTTINAQLDRLQALELDAVLARYGDAVEDSTALLEKNVETAMGTWEDAVKALEDSRDAEIGALERTRDELLKTADSLAAFRAEVAGEVLGAADPRKALAVARAAFAANTDPNKIPELGKALLAASKAGAGSAIELARDRAAVLQRATAAEDAARAQAAALDRQIADLNLKLAAYLPPVANGLQSVDASIQALVAATAALAAAQAAQAAAIQAAAGAINDNLSATVKAAESTGFNAAGISASVDAGATLGAAEVAAAGSDTTMLGVLVEIARNTGVAAVVLDDVSQGGTALRTEAA